MPQYPTSSVKDGITSESLQIPKCIQLEDGNFYCYDHRGRLVSIQNVPAPINLDTSKIATKLTAISASIITSPISPIIINSSILFNTNSPLLQSNNGYFNNKDAIWQGWPSLSVYKGSLTPGVNNTYGSTVTLFSNTAQEPRIMFIPLFISVTWGGSFASGETVSVMISITISYSTYSINTINTGSFTASATSPGTQNFGCSQIYATIAPYLNPNYNYNALSNNNQFISQITASAASSASSTSVTVSVTLVGFHT
jgi:hypothetical protein